MNIKGSCWRCGGKFEFLRFDLERIYVRCTGCGARYSYVFATEEEAARYAEEANKELLNRVREGFLEWEKTQWDALHVDIVKFINSHSYVDNDIRFKMAIIACITRGYHIMDEDIYQQCTEIFKITEDIYRHLLKMYEESANDPRLFSNLESYKQFRSDYLKLQTEYLAIKAAKKAAKIVLKQITKPFIPF